MRDTVECPYCEYENDMSDGLVDLPSDNRFDHECENCERDFEVFVDIEPLYSGDKIVYELCENCNEKTRDIFKKHCVFPFPEHTKKLCRDCYQKFMLAEVGDSNV